MAVTTVAIAGSTGSIGTQTIEVVRAEPDRFEVVALGAWSSVDALVAQAAELRPKLVVVGDAVARRRRSRPRSRPAPRCRPAPPPWPSWARWPTSASTAWSGSPACASRWPRWRPGKRLALANKESLIAGGPVVRSVLARPGAGHIVPVDSEHGAVHQCLAASRRRRPDRVARIVLTASGGPFRGRSRAELADVTVDDALAHPTWSMGPEDHRRLVHAHEQGPRGHRGPRAVRRRLRHRLRPHRGRGAPAVDRALDGRVQRRLDHRPALPARHAPADRLRAGLARPHRHAVRCASTGRRAGRSSSSRPTATPSPAWAWPTRPGRAGEPAPAVLNAANEVAVAAFLAGRIALGRPSPTSSKRSCHGMMGGVPTGSTP